MFFIWKATICNFNQILNLSTEALSMCSPLTPFYSTSQYTQEPHQKLMEMKSTHS